MSPSLPGPVKTKFFEKNLRAHRKLRGVIMMGLFYTSWPQAIEETETIMGKIITEFTRRDFVQYSAGSASLLAALHTVPGLMAEMSDEILTPTQTEGPFYPDKLPLDTDNDLLIINDKLTPAVGKITHLTGRVIDQKKRPIRNAVVEIWQTDNNGIYLHSRGGDRNKLDSNFQGFGRMTTDFEGRFYFRTIKPTPYPGRTPHIHFAVEKNGRRILTTQMYVNKEPQNERDGVLRAIRDPLVRETLIVDFKPLPNTKVKQYKAHFEIVVGATPDESETSAPAQGRRRRG